jgi:hypothetical protein
MEIKAPDNGINLKASAAYDTKIMTRKPIREPEAVVEFHFIKNDILPLKNIFWKE